MRVTLDCTPLLGVRTGVGRYVAELLPHLADLAGPGDRLRATAFTWRGELLDAELPAGWTRVGRRVPARLLRAAWSRTSLPPVEALVGSCEVVHATNFVLPPARRAAGVLTVHDLAFLRVPETVDRTSLAYRELVPWGVARAAVVVTPSHATRDDLLDAYGTDPDRVVVTPLGVDPALLSAAPATDAQLDALGLPPRFLLFVGTREPRKNLALLLRAHAAARSEDPDLPDLVVVGARGWGADTGPAPGVRVTGYLARDLLVGLLGRAEALVLPSRYEGFGLPLLEALACGTAVVASDLAVHREVAGPHARYAAVDDQDALAEQLLAAARAGTGEDGEVARRRAWAARWTWRACAESTWDAYRRALG